MSKNLICCGDEKDRCRKIVLTAKGNKKKEGGNGYGIGVTKTEGIVFSSVTRCLVHKLFCKKTGIL